MSNDGDYTYIITIIEDHVKYDVDVNLIDWYCYIYRYNDSGISMKQ